MSDRLLSQSQVEDRVPLSRTQRWRLEKNGQFPARIKLGNPDSRRVAWSESEIEQWIADRMAVRKTAEGQPEAT